MFRRQISTWESEALVHAEILRAVLDSLVEFKSAIDRGTASASAVLDNASAVTTRSAVWVTEWKNRCIDDGVTESVAFEAHATCLPALAYCVDVYRWSLRVAIMQDVAGGDRELAARGIATAQAAALFALHCLEELPTDRAMTHASLQALSAQMRPLTALGGEIRNL
jgi:hypothetical protein